MGSSAGGRIRERRRLIQASFTFPSAPPSRTFNVTEQMCLPVYKSTNDRKKPLELTGQINENETSTCDESKFIN